MKPEKFFDENAIRENFIENFEPHTMVPIFYNLDERIAQADITLQ